MKRSLILLTIVCMTFSLGAQNIKLPTPHKTGGKPLMETLQNRRSDRTFASREIPVQTLSDLLWAAWGFNRENNRTAPSAMNWQETDLYVALPSGTYLYDARNNELKLITKTDLRKASGMQPFVEKAPLNLIYVADLKKTKKETDPQLLNTVYADAGFIAQNVYLYCASEGLNCVVRASIDKTTLTRELKLQRDQVITLAQTIGYPQK